MKRFFLAWAVAFGCVGAGIGGVRQAAAANWTVCATGCSFTTIQKAINSPTVHSGDTIKIRAGTYVENVTIPGTNPNALLSLTLYGAGEGATKIDGGAAGTTLYVNSGLTVTISDLTVTNGKAYPASGIVNLVSTLTLEKVTVSGKPGSG
jgi:pectin methylesterase-like acyl-CoA thioesterase